MLDIRHAPPALIACALALAVAGCGAEPASHPQTPATAARDQVGPDDHVHVAPHGGVLTELGDHYAQLEVVVDPAEGMVTLYVLDAEAQRAIRIGQSSVGVVATTGPSASISLQLTPVASALTGERAGEASEFRAQSDALRGATRVDVRIESVTVRGQSFDNLHAVWTLAGVS